MATGSDQRKSLLNFKELEMAGGSPAVTVGLSLNQKVCERVFDDFQQAKFVICQRENEWLTAILGRTLCDKLKLLMDGFITKFTFSPIPCCKKLQKLFHLSLAGWKGHTNKVILSTGKTKGRTKWGKCFPITGFLQTPYTTDLSWQHHLKVLSWLYWSLFHCSKSVLALYKMVTVW